MLFWYCLCVTQNFVVVFTMTWGQCQKYDELVHAIVDLLAWLLPTENQVQNNKINNKENFPLQLVFASHLSFFLAFYFLLLKKFHFFIDLLLLRLYKLCIG